VSIRQSSLAKFVSADADGMDHFSCRTVGHDVSYLM